MQDRTIGIILTLKNIYSKGYKDDKDYKEELFKFLCDYSMTDYEWMKGNLPADWKDSMIHKNLIDAFCDYIGTADNPKEELIKFFSYRYGSEQPKDESYSIIMIFVLSDVIRTFNLSDKEHGSKFVNGFRYFKYKDLELTLNSNSTYTEIIKENNNG